MKATCHICGKEISRPSAMKMHIETMHTDLSEAKCEECDAVLKSQRHLELHIKRCHLVTKRSHLCHLCPASFKVSLSYDSRLTTQTGVVTHDIH